MNSASLSAGNLTLEVGPSGAIRLVDRAAGTRWESGGPAVVLHAANVPEVRVIQRTADSADGCEVSVVATGKQVRLNFAWKSLGIDASLELRLTRDRLEARLPLRRVRERDAARFRVMSFDLLPDFASAPQSKDGYLVLPCFSGARCGLDRSDEAEVRMGVYLPQEQWELWTSMPVFGLSRQRGGLLGIIVSGDFDAQIVARRRRDAAKDQSRSSVFPSLLWRRHKTDVVDPIDRVVHYLPLSGNDGGYVGMARAYRRHLVDHLKVPTLRQRVRRNPQLAYEFAAYSCKIFHAMKARHPRGRGRYQRFTSFADAERMVRLVHAAGVRRASYQLTGWNIDGHDGQFPRRLPVDPRLGGERGLRRLLATAGRLDHRVGFHDNYVDAYPASPDWDPAIIARDRDGEMMLGGVWGGGLQHLICSHAMPSLLRRDLPRVLKLGFDGISYLDAVPRAMRACHCPDHDHAPTARAEAEGILALLRTARTLAHPRPVGCENAWAWSLAEQDYAAHIVHDTPGRSGAHPAARCFVDELIPFFHIAAHGLVKYHLCDMTGLEHTFGSLAAGVLKQIELGAMPRFEFCFRDRRPEDPGYLHMGDYRRFVPWMQVQNRILCEELADLQYEPIVDHRRTSDGLAQTTYENGVSVHLDYRRRRYRVSRPGQNGNRWQSAESAP